jgi:hypothetical protein
MISIAVKIFSEGQLNEFVIHSEGFEIFSNYGTLTWTMVEFIFHSTCAD